MVTIEQQRLAEIDRHLRDTQTRLNDDTQLQTERYCLWLMARVRELDAELAAAAARVKALEAGLQAGKALADAADYVAAALLAGRFIGRSDANDIQVWVQEFRARAALAAED